MTQRNFLPPMVGISMSKAQFAFCTGLTPYKLRCILQKNEKKLQSLGYSRYDKILMPSVVLWLLDETQLQIDVDLLAQTDRRLRSQLAMWLR